ncbi:MAG TPA: hypothetical protein VHA73_04030 [Acidimicrobiales bacterium]|nr:hypothetical protein [Acidimicrobiales bacterium]
MHPSISIARSRRLLTVVAVTAVVVGLCLAAARAGAQTGTSDGTDSGGTPSSVSVTTTVDLVNGSVNPTTTTSTIAASVTKADHSADKHRTTNWKVWAIVAGLVLVALLMAVLTWRYWARTRPPRGAAAKGAALTLPGAGSSAADAEQASVDDDDGWAAPEAADTRVAVVPGGAAPPAEDAADAGAFRSGRRGRGRRESRYANLEISLPAHPDDEPSDI